MEVILLERVAKLGQMGEVVRVKDGFARNFLLPKGKALRATEANKSKFEGMKVDLQAKNLETKAEADKIGSKLDGKSLPGDPPGLGNRPALRLGVAARSRRRCSPRTASRSTATRSRSTCRSRPSASTRCRCICIRRSRSPSRSTSRAAPTRPSGWRAARTSPSAAKAAPTRTKPRPRKAAAEAFFEPGAGDAKTEDEATPTSDAKEQPAKA